MMDAQHSKEFLEKYLEEHEVPVVNSGKLPFRLSPRVSESELEGESIGIALQHLKQSACPDLLSLYIARESTDVVLKEDLLSTDKQTEDDTTYYGVATLTNSIYSAIHNVCTKWNQDLPQILSTHKVLLQCSDHGIRNTRRKMEDKHSTIADLNILTGSKDLPQLGWYAVYDGHGGLDASNYASKQLQFNFAKQDNCRANIDEALKSSIKTIDEDFCVKAKQETLRSGTTAVVAVIAEAKLYLAWVGDSQAVLVRDGLPITMMNPHKPEREDEKARIEELGGCVVWFGAWRVNGSLSVSRAIGDAEHKPFVSGDADTAVVPLDGTEDFLCLACDGFWDVFNEKDLVGLVRDHLAATNDRTTVAQTLCTKAKENGSSDNITVVVVFMRETLNLKENNAAEELSKLSLPEDDQTTEQPNGDNANNNSNNNNTNDHNNDNNNLNNTTSGNEKAEDCLAVLHGFHVKPAEKIKIPHRLLVNYVKNETQKKRDKTTIIVTSSAPHAKLPTSLQRSRWSSSQHSPPSFRRRDTRGSLLSLSTVESITELQLSDARINDDAKSSCSLPLIHNVSSKSRSGRLSATTSPYERGNTLRPLGYRAPHNHTRGRTRIPYQASLVVTCRENALRSKSSSERGYSRSIPDDLNGVVRKNGLVKDTNIVITNSLSPTIKPRNHKKFSHKNSHHRPVVKLTHRGRQRSRSAF